MAGRRMSGRRLSMSKAAKRILKEKRRKKKRGAVEKEDEGSNIGFWVFAIAALIVLGYVVSRVLS